MKHEGEIFKNRSVDINQGFFRVVGCQNNELQMAPYVC